MGKFVLDGKEIGVNPTSEEYAKVILARFGLLPRKKGSTDKMHRILLQMYERTKQSLRDKRPEFAVCTVEELGHFAGISRQTMYEYLGRWTNLRLITKASFIQGNSVVVGYRLNGNTLEAAFEKAVVAIRNHTELSMKYVTQLQKVIKNEKISAAQHKNQPLKAEIVEKEPESDSEAPELQSE